MRRRDFIALAGIAASFPGRAFAQSDNLTRITVGFPPGGTTDIVARTLAAHLKLEGTTNLVDNRAGAAGRLAVDYVKRAQGNGRTILVTPGAIMAIYPHVYKKLGYDPLTDFKAVSSLVTAPYGICVGPAVPEKVKTLSDFGRWCKENPKLAAYGTPGQGTAPHFLGAMFARTVGIDFLHVPFRGGAPAIQDVIGGQIAASINNVNELIPHAQAGRLRILGISSPQRFKALPAVPTFAEAGMKDLESEEWLGVFLPASASNDQVSTLSTAVREAFSRPAAREGLEKLGFTINTSTPAEFEAKLKADIKRWAPVVKATGFSLDE